MTLLKMRLRQMLGLLLAFTLIMAVLPASPGHASQVRDLRAYFDQLDARGGDWWKNHNNDSGFLAFRQAYVLQSYLLMYETYKDTYYLDKFIDHADSVLKQRDSVRKVTDYRGLSLPAWRHTDSPGASNPKILGGKYFHVAVDTANISYPYAWFARIVKNDSKLSAYDSKANTYVQAAKDALSVHEDEWRESGNTGWYIFRKGSPYWCDGVGIPFNQNVGLARTMLNIYQVTGEAKYLDRVTKIAQHFKNHLTLETDRYVWNYWWGFGYNGWTSSQSVSANTPSYGGYKKFEDFRHGAVDGDFVVMAHQAGIVFTDTDLQRFANTIEKNLIRSDGKINEFVNSTPVNGANELLIGLWLRFYKLAPSLFDATYNRASNYSSVGGPGLLVVAYMNWAYNGGGSNPAGPPPSNPPAPPADTVAPQVSIVQPASGSFLSPQASLAATATDNVGVTKVDFEYSQNSGGPWTLAGSGTQGSQHWSLNWNTQALSDGTYHLRARAWDAAGNIGVSTPVTLNVDRTAPVVDNLTAGTGAFTPNGSNTVNISYRLSEQALVTTTVNSGTSQVAVLENNVDKANGVHQVSWNGTANGSIVPVGNYTVRVSAVDANGNQSAVATTAITVQAPAPAPPPANNSGELVVNGNFSQNKTGWSNGGTIVTETNGNRYVTNDYNWQLFQDLKLSPGQYSITASARKGTGANARIVVMYIDSSGNRTTGKDITYIVKGAGWETIPVETFTVPASAATTRIYLLNAVSGKTAGFDNISLKQAGQPVVVQPTNLITNGGFTQNRAGWSAGGTIKTETNGNKYVSNVYNWQLFQDLTLTPGQRYKINAQTKRGTAGAIEARIVVAFIDTAGNRTVPHDFRHLHKGTGWEAITEQTFTVPAGTVTTRIYLLSATNKGFHDFDNITLTP